MENNAFEESDFFGIKSDNLLLEKNVINVINEALWKNFDAPEFAKDEAKIDSIKEQVIRKINVEKYGLQNLLKNKKLLTELTKEIANQILERRYGLKPKNKASNKLSQFDNNNFKVGLKSKISEICKF